MRTLNPPVIPLYDSATLRIKVGIGKNQIFRAYQELLVRYGSSNTVTSESVALASGQSQVSPPGAVTSLTIDTDTPVKLTYTQPGGAPTTVTVEAQFTLVAPISQWSILNDGVDTANVTFVSILSSEFK